MLKSFKNFLLEKQEGMLDISIPSFFKYTKVDPKKPITGSKALANAESRIRTVLLEPLTIQEKVDGVKLSIIRNDVPYDEHDYSKNWIVAYKTFILYPFEHEDVPLEQIQHPTNYGNSQYRLIHEALIKAHPKLRSVPLNTEFFLEFLMRKPTLTRSYGGSTHSVIFLASSPTTVKIERGHVYTESSEFNRVSTMNNSFCEATGFQPPEEIFKGPILLDQDNTLRFNEHGILFEGVRHRYQEIEDSFTRTIQTRQWLDIALQCQHLFTTFKSVYGGGVPEGVVCWPEDSTTPFKFVPTEQYDTSIRKVIRSTLLGSDEKTLDNYFAKIEERAEEIFASIDKHLPFAEQLRLASKLVYNQNLDDIGYAKKTNLNKQDDLFLKIKSFLIEEPDSTSTSVVNRSLKDTSTVGLVVGKFRLPTISHFALIKKALEFQDQILIALVDTSKKGLSFTERQKIFETSFPGQVRVTRVDSANLGIILKSFKNKIKYVFCGTDAIQSYQNQVDQFNNLYGTSVKVIELPRAEDDEVSATAVETAIKDNDKGTFDRLASKPLKQYWDVLVNRIKKG